MKSTKRKLSPSLRTLPSEGILRGSESSARLPSDYSPPTLEVKGVKERENLSIFTDYHLTVRQEVELTRYHMSMLLSMLVYESVNFGLDFSTWLSLEWLFSKLIGSKRVWEVRDIRERRELLSAELVLLTTQNSWLSLGQKEELPQDIKDYLLEQGLLIGKRVYESRKEHWKLNKFLSVRAVPVDVEFERGINSNRYSSYTKGYGESSRMGRRQKTRPSSELDGEDSDRPEVVIPLKEIPNLLFLNLVELRKKSKIRKA